jgi:hypothetical protein
MAAHKGPASLRPRCTRSGSSVAAIPVYPEKGALLQNGEKRKVTVHGAPRGQKAYIQSGAALFPKGKEEYKLKVQTQLYL